MPKEIKEIDSRDACKEAMTQWVRSLMAFGQVTPTQLAVNLTVVYSSTKAGVTFDHNRQRLFKSSVSKWRKGVQSPSLDNCGYLEAVRLSIKEELAGSKTPEGDANALALSELGRVGIVDLRLHLDSFPRGSKRRREVVKIDLEGKNKALDSSIQSLLHLIQRSMDDSSGGEELPQTFQERVLKGRFGKTIEQDDPEMEALKLRLGEMVLSMFLKERQGAEEGRAEEGQAED